MSSLRSSFTPLPHSLKSNDWFIWSIAISLSVSAHVLFFLHRQPLISAPASIIQETITRVRFASIAPAPVPEPEKKMVRPEPLSPVKPLAMQKPRAKEIPKAQLKPKPVPQTEVKKPPVKKLSTQQAKQPVKPKPVQRQQPLKSSPAMPAPAVRVEKKLQASSIAAQTNVRLLEQTRKSYQALLMRHIEVHKHYPRVARKRNIQGKIVVSFTIHADGSIKQLSLSGHHAILKKATNQAINNALPMPKPPLGLSLPMDIKFAMHYSLQ